MMDSVYLNCRREAILIFLLWLAVSTYSIVVSYLYGYTSHEPAVISSSHTIEEFIGPLESFNRVPSTLTTPLGLGIPDWVFYAVVVPWFFCILITWFFCVFYMKDDDLGLECSGPEDKDRAANG